MKKATIWQVQFTSIKGSKWQVCFDTEIKAYKCAVDSLEVNNNIISIIIQERYFLNNSLKYDFGEQIETIKQLVKNQPKKLKRFSYNLKENNIEIVVHSDEVINKDIYVIDFININDIEYRFCEYEKHNVYDLYKFLKKFYTGRYVLGLLSLLKKDKNWF